MENKVLLVCEENECSEGTVNRVIEFNNESGISEVRCLKIIKHPPMQDCEHGGADTEKKEKALDKENQQKQERWIAHEEEVHGAEMKVLVDKLKKGGIGDVKIRFLTKEIGFGNSVIHELEDGNYDTIVVTEGMWENMNGKKVPSRTKVITVSNPL